MLDMNSIDCLRDLKAEMEKRRWAIVEDIVKIPIDPKTRYSLYLKRKELFCLDASFGRLVERIANLEEIRND